jgi:hypothetical protein
MIFNVAVPKVFMKKNEAPQKTRSSVGFISCLCACAAFFYPLVSLPCFYTLALSLVSIPCLYPLSLSLVSIPCFYTLSLKIIGIHLAPEVQIF